MSQQYPRDYRKVQVNLKELKEEMRKNMVEREKFIEMLAAWIKKTPNKVWSRQQKEFLE